MVRIVSYFTDCYFIIKDLENAYMLELSMTLDYSKSYEVIDNFLDQEDFNHIKEVFLSPEFPWYYNSTKVAEGYDTDNPYNYQFNHMFYKEEKELSKHCSVIEPLFLKFDHNGRGRTKANLTTKTPKIMEFTMHTDYKRHRQSMRTAVYYINNNNGYTKFENGETIESVENRLIHFDSRFMHTGSTHTDEKVRVVLNLNFLIRN
jgi:hypothetical protein